MRTMAAIVTLILIPAGRKPKLSGSFIFGLLIWKPTTSLKRQLMDLRNQRKKLKIVLKSSIFAIASLLSSLLYNDRPFTVMCADEVL